MDVRVSPAYNLRALALPLLQDMPITRLMMVQICKLCLFHKSYNAPSYFFIFYFLHLIILLVSEVSVLCMKFCNAERNEGVDGESPQRCKARLERHQRTAERAV